MTAYQAVVVRVVGMVVVGATRCYDARSSCYSNKRHSKNNS